jgi:hypothetical protein
MIDDENIRIKTSLIFHEHVFKHLKDLNSGFDSSSIAYFSSEDFMTILLRIIELGLGVTGKEPWKNINFFDVATFEKSGRAPEDHEWYISAFDRFKEMDAYLQYSATYSIPDGHILLSTTL